MKSENNVTIDENNCGRCAGTSDTGEPPQLASTIQSRFELTEPQKKELLLLLAALIIGVSGLLLWEQRSVFRLVPYTGMVGVILLLAAYLLAGFDVLKGAVQNIRRGLVFDELFLMSIASLGAFAIGAREEAVGVMIFYRVGEFLQDVAVGKSRRSIKALVNLRPDKARVYKNNSWIETDPGSVQAGDLLLVKPGERVPVDGEIVDGTGTFDTSALTGESLPRPVINGSEVLSGFIVQSGAVTLRALRPASVSAASRIISMVENAAKSKAKPELIIHRFARWYTPVVVFGALAIALLPPLLIPGQLFSEWLYRALVMLVISCPCAFVISVPLSYFAGLGGAARKGILIKGAVVLDSLADARTVVFDKTGTLTKGVFQVHKIVPAEGFGVTDVLSNAAAAGTHSIHPLAQAIQRFAMRVEQDTLLPDTRNFQEIPGHGSVAQVQGKEIVAGNDRILHLKQIPHTCDPGAESVIHVAVAGKYAGKIELKDVVKEDAKEAMQELRTLGIQNLALFTGDGEGPALETAQDVGIPTVHHTLLPEDKVKKIEELVLHPNKKGTVLFVGDGINDAPVLARSDAGIAMGGRGTDAAIESADVVLMTDEVRRIPQAIAHAKKTRRIVVQNIIMALGIKLLFLTLGAFGVASMWEAVIADVGVALAAVLNATRALR